LSIQSIALEITNAYDPAKPEGFSSSLVSTCGESWDKADRLHVKLGFKARIFRIRPALKTIEPATTVLIGSGYDHEESYRIETMIPQNVSCACCSAMDGTTMRPLLRRREEEVTEEDVRRMADIFGARSTANRHMLVQRVL
jgi:hypothetical protein